MEDADAVVVGAGSSGLAAAKLLRAAGLTFDVFVAMSATGGEMMRRNQASNIALSAAPARSEANPS
jgi:monoamine oxidase